jgi:hypothetical protein
MEMDTTRRSGERIANRRFHELRSIAGVSQRAILALPLGHWRLSVKRFVLALI